MFHVFNRGFSFQFALLVAGDIAVAFAGAVGLGALMGAVLPQCPAWGPQLLAEGAVFTAVLCAAFFYRDLYDSAFYGPGRWLFVRWCQSMALWFVLVVALKTVLYPDYMRELRVCVATAGAGGMVLFWRHMFRTLTARFRFSERVLICGTGEKAKIVAAEILSHRAPGFSVSGFIGPRELVGVSILNPTVLGTYEDLAAVLERESVSTIVVAEDNRRNTLPMDTLIQHRLRGGRVLDDTTFMETTLGRIPLGSVQPAWFVFSPGFNRGWLYLGAKRAVEVVLALSVLAVSLPVWALLAALIKLDSPGPVIFKQRRVGADGREFEVLKFRSMRRDAEASGARWASADDARITRVGRVIRALRLDELPQLWNILRGDMSLVGPRPERPEFVSWLAKEIPYYATRHRVKPGLTGWAQINYRYGASLDDARVKLEYDLYYIKHMAFFLDLFIIVKTAKTVLFDRSGR